HHFINADFFSHMKDGAYFINASRGEVVDQKDLIAAMHQKHLRVGLDVYASEPGANDEHFTDSIRDEPLLYGTHHIGASTDQAQDAVSEESVRIVSDYIKHGTFRNHV